MQITQLRTNHIKNPIGFSMEYPCVSWQVEDSGGKKQAKARIRVALDEDMKEIVYDTLDKELDSTGTILSMKLQECTRYYWNVWTESDTGETGISLPAWFETAKNESAWTGQWIRPMLEEDSVLFQKFTVEKEVEWARLTISGVGFYEAYLDGEKIGDEYLAPGVNDYDSWIQFQTYPVEEMLLCGSHKIEIVLGSGWYKGRYLTFCHGTPKEKYGNTVAAIAELSIRYTDGSTGLIKTDLSWKCRKSRVRENGIYDGEVYDAGFDISQIYPVETAEIGTSRLKARLSLPVRRKEVKKPERIIHTPKGEVILDFGQNMAGWLIFYNRLPKGKTCECIFGEILQGGCFYHENMRSAKTEFTFISDGREGWIRPHFTYYGFRYVKLVGFESISKEDFEAWVLYSDMEQTGIVTTGHEKVNRLISNILWSQKSNFIDVPTDCPQRDERLGWTGDTQIFSMTAAFNMDTHAFFRKHMFDVRCEQKKNQGMVPMVVPDLFLTATSSAWGDVAVIVPWNMYLMYGDRQLLREQYPGMKNWIDYVYHLDEENGGCRLWNMSSHFGDWLSLDALNGEATGGTDVHLIATAYYYYCTGLLAKAAAIIGKEDDTRWYSNLQCEIKKAFLKEYFTVGGRLSVDTQTAYILVLYMDLYPAGLEQKLTDALVQKLRERNNHLVTGFVGTPYLCLVLSKFGRSDLAYTLLLNEDFPSWLYCVNMGATTIWERWDSVLEDGTMNPNGMNSLNHYAYGSIQEWMYKYVLGIMPKDGCPAWKQFILAPKPDKRLGSAKGSFRSPAGLIESSWVFEENGELNLHFEVPFNTVAELFLPDGRQTVLDAGKYDFRVLDFADPVKWSKDSILDEILADKEAHKTLVKYLPELVERKAEYASMSLLESVMSVFNSYTLLDLKNVEQEFNKIQ